MKNMKKFISIILCLIMVFSLTSTAFAANTKPVPTGDVTSTAKQAFEYLNQEQQAAFLRQIEALAWSGDTSLTDFHKTHVDPNYSFNRSTATTPIQTRAAVDIAGQLQALNLPSAVYYGLLAFSTALGVPMGNVVDVVIGLGLAAIIVSNWEAISGVWQDIVDIFVDAFGSTVMSAFYYLQGLVGVYTVTISGSTITVNGKDYVCDEDAETVALSMSRNGHTYYPAYRTNNTVLVCPEDIPRKAALEIMRLNHSRAGVFTIQSNYAQSLCQTLGGGIRGPEGEFASGYWMHYHSIKYPYAHCWYIS